MTHSLSNLSVAQLKQAIAIREKIEALEQELAAVFGDKAVATVAVPKKRRTMSAAARKRIGAAQKARWAQLKGTGKPARASKAAAPAAAPKRKMSPAGRRRLAQLAKARWAKVKAAGQSSLKAG